MISPVHPLLSFYRKANPQCKERRKNGKNPALQRRVFEMFQVQTS